MDSPTAANLHDEEIISARLGSVSKTYLTAFGLINIMSSQLANRAANETVSILPSGQISIQGKVIGVAPCEANVEQRILFWWLGRVTTMEVLLRGNF